MVIRVRVLDGRSVCRSVGLGFLGSQSRLSAPGEPTVQLSDRLSIRVLNFRRSPSLAIVRARSFGRLGRAAERERAAPLRWRAAF